MKPKLFFSVLIFIFSNEASYSQNYLITNTLPGNDSIAFTALRYGRKDYGFGVISSKGIMNWQVPVPGYPLGMGKLNNNVVFFYTTEDPEALGPIKEVHAALINLREKKITKDEVVYSKEDKYWFYPFILDDPQGNFVYLLIRTSALKGLLGNGYSQARNKVNETTGLRAISLGTNLESHTKDIKSIVLESTFASACVGMNNDLYVSSLSNDQLITEKFDSNANLKGKLSTEALVANKKEFFPLIKYDSLRGNCIDETIAYPNRHKDDVMRSFRFDFNDQKATATDEVVLDKSYTKQLEKATGRSSKLSNFKSINELYPIQILETADKVIVLKEIQYHFTPIGDDAERFYREGSIISIYSKKDMSSERDIVIDKNLETFVRGSIGIYSELKNGKLYTVTCELTGPGTCKTYLYTVNINDGLIEKRELKKVDAGGGWITYPATIAWFSNNFITSFNSSKISFRMNFETDLQSENYNK